jgi:Tfp pilus assembly protein PilW
MRLRPKIAPVRGKASQGYSLIELIISFVIGLAVIATVVTLSIISAQNFAATANYVQMNDQSRNAVDLISREVRNASALTAFSTNNPQSLVFTNSNTGTTTTIICNTNANAGTLVLSVTGQPDKTLLTGCDSFSFKLYNRYPDTNNYSFYASTNITGQWDSRFCKVINMNWKCSRAIRGSKLNTEVVQTAQVVLRNQVTE